MHWLYVLGPTAVGILVALLVWACLAAASDADDRMMRTHDEEL